MAATTTGTTLEETVQSLRERYILPHNVEEIKRMQNQHEWVKGCADGLIKAPLDMTRKDLCILDAATADGVLLTSDIEVTFC